MKSMEIWKPIPDWEKYYEVSTLGRVRSLNRVVNTKGGRTKIHKGIVLAYGNSNGYRTVRLRLMTIDQTRLVHRLVAFAFIKQIKGKKHVNHINGIKTDNRVENLEWCTPSENEKHSYRVLGKINFRPNTGKFGRASSSSKRIEQYTLDGVFIKRWDCHRDAAVALGLQESNISHVIKGRRNHAGGFVWKGMSQ